MNPSQTSYKKYDRLQKNPRWHLTGRIKMSEIEDGGGPLDQYPVREHGYHPTLESLPTKKKKEQESLIGILLDCKYGQYLQLPPPLYCAS